MNTNDDRRRWPRHAAGEWDWEPVVAIRNGQQAAVINWSRAGLLVESPRRLVPGARVALSLRGPDGGRTVQGQVVRAAVCGVTPHHGVCYRAAIKMDEPIPGPWRELHRPGS